MDSLNRFIIFLTIFYSVLGIFQFLVPASAGFFVFDLTQFGFNADVSDLDQRVVGLTFSPAHYGNLISLLLTYLVALVLSKKYLGIPSSLIILGIMIGFFSIVLSGIRTSLFSFAFGVLLIAIITKNARLFFIIFLTVVVIIFSWSIIISIGGNYNYSDGFSNPFARTLQLFSYFDSGALNTESTFKLTVWALEDFFKNPIIGSGDDLSWLLDYSLTDAWLLYHLVQFGIFGVVIIFFPYFFIIRFNKILISILIVPILQTITDMGIFYSPVNIFLWIIYAITLKNSSNQVCHEKNSFNYSNVTALSHNIL